MLDKGSVEKCPAKDDIKSEEAAQQLLPTLNALQGAALIVGAIIGAGIFGSPTSTLQSIGATVPSLILWLICGLVTTSAALMYAEWGSRVPLSGADTPYLDHAFKKPARLFAILYSWIRVVLVNPGYNLMLGVGAARNFLVAINVIFSWEPKDEKVQKWTVAALTWFIIIAQAGICVRSNNMAGKFLTFVAALAVFSVSIFCFCGFLVVVGALPSVSTSNAMSTLHAFKGTSVDPKNWASAFYSTLWAFDGFSNLASSLGELKNPERNISRSTFLGMGLVVVLYLLANVSFFVTLSFEEMIKIDSFTAAGAWGSKLFGPAGTAIASLMVFLCASSCNFVSTYSASRIGQSTGEARMIIFPDFFAKLSKFGTPVNALIVNTVIACALVPLSFNQKAYGDITEMISAPLWIFYLLTSIGLLLVKYRSMGSIFGKDPKVRGYQVHAAIPIMIIILAIFLTFYPLVTPLYNEDPAAKNTAKNVGIGIVCILTGLVPYYFLEMHKKGSKLFERFPGRIRVFYRNRK